MLRDLQESTDLTAEIPIAVERVRLADSDIAVEAGPQLPSIVPHSADNEFFLTAFMRSQGSIDLTSVILK